VLRGACKKLRVDSVKMLLAAGADVNRHVAGRSALSYAVLALCPEESIADKIDVINALFDAGCSVQRAEDGSSIMHSADSDTIWELASVADVLASRDPSIVHCSNCKGVTALMTVVGSPVKAVSLVTSLLYAGANPRARDNRGASALFYLFYTNFRSKSEDITDIHEILGILISAGADLTACKDTGETLLIQAVSKVEHRLRYGIISQATKYSDEETSALLSAILDAVAAQEQEQEVEEEVEVVEQQVEQEQERERGVEEVVKKKKSRGDDVPPQKRVKRQAA
jgi:ankyrin repeat protein